MAQFCTSAGCRHSPGHETVVEARSKSLAEGTEGNGEPGVAGSVPVQLVKPVASKNDET